MPTRTANGSSPPTRERGGSSVASTGSALLSWSALGAGSDSMERTPKLLFPQSPFTFADMMTDPQCEGLVAGVQLPILRMNWSIRPNGAPMWYVKMIAEDLGLPIEGQRSKKQGRSKRRFKFNEHLAHALDAIVFGFMYFEQVGDIRANADAEAEAAELYWRLRKLAPRMPQTISEVNVARDGGLESVRQGLGIDDKPIPVDALVAYVWGKKGANWFGRSMLRSCYGSWLLKDRVRRVGAINIERNGAGTPVFEAPPGATPDEIAALDRMAQRFKAGSRAGGAVPNGTKAQLLGVTGSQPDAVGFIRMCNEEMARSFLMMFMQLGQTETGSRSLGESFIDFFSMKLEAVATWFAENFNEHVIEDWVDWNIGEDAPAPLLVWSWGDGQISSEELSSLVTSGIIQVDDELENAIRVQKRLPERKAPRATPQPPPTSEPEDEEEDPTSPEQVAATAKRRERRGASGVAHSPATVMLPPRPLRRQPYDHEVAAAVDFAAIDAAWQSALDLLVMEVRQLQDYQIDELHDQIVAADGNLDDLMEMGAEPMASDVIYSRLQTVADLAMTEALNEASRQGATVDRPDMDDLYAEIKTRAEVVDKMLASELTDQAARRAVRLTGGGLEPVEVAEAVRNDLRGLTGAAVRDRLGGALTASQNASRGLLFARSEPARIYASELLDGNTCANCIGRDGTEYVSMIDASRDYPTGGFKDCLGQERCRGTLVAVYGEDG